MDASSVVIPQVQVDFFNALNKSALPEENYNSLMGEVYQKAQKYIKEEPDVNELNKFKSRITQELSKMENRSDVVSKTHSVTTSIIQVQKEKCQKLLELLDQKINQVATRSLAGIPSVEPTAVTSPTPTAKDAAALNRLKQNREKTEKIKEQIIRYIVDPSLQVNDIMNFVEGAYETGPFKREYTLAKEIVVKGDMDPIPEDIDETVFHIQVAALARIELLRNEIKSYGDEARYKFNPSTIALIGNFANALVSFELLGDKELRSKGFGPHDNAIKILDKLESEGKKIIRSLEFRRPLESVPNDKFELSTLKWHMYENLYPIVLGGNLGVYTFEASVFAFANRIALFGINRSERGLHGGVYQEPLVIFSHDVIHHNYILSSMDRVLANRFLNFSRALYDVINEKIPEQERDFFYWCAHMLLHETDFPAYTLDYQVNQNPVLSEIFDMSLCNVLETFFKDLGLNSNLEPWEEKVRKEKNLLLYNESIQDTPKNQGSDKQIATYVAYSTDASKKIEDVVTQGNKSSFPYDVIEAMFFLTADPEKKKNLESLILPGFADYAANLKTELQNKFQVSDKTDKTSDEYKNYLKELNSQLYTFKTQNYNQLEAYKALRERMYEFKNRMMPFLQEIDQVNGPIVDDNYKNVWEQGKEIYTETT